VPAYQSGDADGDEQLDLTETWVYFATGTAVAGAYTNMGTARGTDATGTVREPVTASEPDGYFGVDPRIQVVKRTNGHDNDADFKLAIGSAVTWTYTVTNTGNVPLANVQVTDNRPGVVPAYQSGDADGDGQLDLTETWVYAATGTAVAGEYTNLGTARGTDATGTVREPVTASEPDGYFGVDPRIQVVKRTNGHDNDADFKLAIGSTVTWTYTVSNPGNVPLRNVRVTDDNGTPDFFADDFSPVFVSGDTNSDGLLDPGEVWVYMATGVAIAGQYSNLGTVKGTDDTGTVPTPVENSDADYYFGRKESPAIVVGPDKSPSTPQEVAVVASDTGKVVTRFAAYENDYVGGTRVAVADLDGDGTDEIITAPGRSRAPEVRVFTMQGDAVPGFPAFFGNSPTFRGGIHLAAADVNGDGKPDIITVPSYGAVEVRVFLNRYPQSPAFVDVADISFLAFPTASIGGGVVHAGDMGRLVNGSFVNLPDKKAEIVVATGGGTKAAVTVFDVSEATPTRVQTFYPFTAVSNNFQGGVSLEVARVDADGVPDIIAGMGANGSSRIEVWAWSASETSLDMLGAIPNAFEGPSSTAPVKMGVADSNGDGIADSLFAVQGPDGTTGEIHRFKINGTASFLYQQIPSLTDFPGSWFIATSETATAEAVWTNPLNPFDVDNDGRVIPLDVLETVNYINTHPGETALPAKQFSPPRFFDTNADRAITPGDVLVVLNYLNDSEVSAGEGEASEPPEEFRAMPSPLGFDVGLAARPDVSSASDGRPDRALAVVRTTTVPGAEWTRPGPGSPLVLHSSKPQFEDPNLSELESVLEVIAPEIAAGYW